MSEEPQTEPIVKVEALKVSRRNQISKVKFDAEDRAPERGLSTEAMPSVHGKSDRDSPLQSMPLVGANKKLKPEEWVKAPENWANIASRSLSAESISALGAGSDFDSLPKSKPIKLSANGKMHTPDTLIQK